MRARLVRSISPSVRRALGWALVALALSLFLGTIPGYQGWDQTFYLAQTSSLVEDGDLDLRNDFLRLQREPTALLRKLTRIYPNGALINNRPIGPSTLWLPVYALSLPLQSVGSAAPGQRWALPQLAALQLFSLALMAWLLWVLDRWLRRMGVRRWLAALSALALVMGTPLLIYGFRGFRGSHLASAVAVMWLVLAAIRLGRRPTAGAALLCGVALGLAFLCRWQDVVKGVVLLVPALQLWRSGLPLRRGLRLAVVAAAGALAVAGLQVHAWALERGEILGLPQGSGYLHLGDPELVKFLFSGLSSLVPWSPVFALGALGLLLPWRCRLPASWRWVALAILVFDVYLNASVADWWGGSSYGARRMCSDVPLLALGLGNLTLVKRARWPVAALLGLFCLWGAMTSNLFTHGLRDLSLLVAGRPSEAPRAQRESGAQPTPAEARSVAAQFPLRYRGLDYFPGVAGSAGRVLTAAVMASVVLLLAWVLGRARPPTLLGVVLVSLLAVVLLAHGRLLVSGRGDPEERIAWKRLVRAARGEAGAPVEPGAGVGRLPSGPEDEFSDARRYLRVFALKRQGRLDEARDLAAGLAEKGYPFLGRLRPVLALAPGESLVASVAGPFYEVSAHRPARALALARKVDLRREKVRLRMELRMGRVTPGTPRLLFAWGRRGEDSLARVVALGETLLVLETPSARAEAEISGRTLRSYTLELEWSPRERRIAVAVTPAGDEPVRLAAAASPSPGESGRIELRLGSPPEETAFETPWQAGYSDLWMAAGRDAPPRGSARPPGRRRQRR